MTHDQTSFGMAYNAETEIKGVFDERFEEYTEKIAGTWTLGCTDTCLCSTTVDCDPYANY
ncbi:hypothetical protein [Halorussus litoreus]|uniref:hypothetical protein n=1 Tax=Halorussus litoreus TaxID=1710536 RepID=UPI001300A2BC|nr:hypothetical protein [Halorussus litoreus]